MNFYGLIYNNNNNNHNCNGIWKLFQVHKLQVKNNMIFSPIYHLNHKKLLVNNIYVSNLHIIERQQKIIVSFNFRDFY